MVERMDKESIPRTMGFIGHKPVWTPNKHGDLLKPPPIFEGATLRGGAFFCPATVHGRLRALPPHGGTSRRVESVPRSREKPKKER